MQNYHSKIVEIGKEAYEIMQNDMIILFFSNAPQELKDYCIIHEASDSIKSLKAGDRLVLSAHHYTIVNIGSTALDSLEDLGHVTLKFNMKEDDQILPGSIHLKEKLDYIPQINDCIMLEHS